MQNGPRPNEKWQNLKQNGCELKQKMMSVINREYFDCYASVIWESLLTTESRLQHSDAPQNKSGLEMMKNVGGKKFELIKRSWMEKFQPATHQQNVISYSQERTRDCHVIGHQWQDAPERNLIAMINRGETCIIYVYLRLLNSTLLFPRFIPGSVSFSLRRWIMYIVGNFSFSARTNWCSNDL